MPTEPSFRTFESVELFTIFSLERSETGLDLLIQETRRAAQALASGETASGLQTLQSLIERLYDFRQFTRDVCAIFALSPAQVGDAKGTMLGNADRFRRTLYALSDALEAHDTEQMAQLLDTTLPEALLRFRELMPQLRAHIIPHVPDAA
jgi:hypothetical protein